MRRHGFTLIELLVVIAIIAVLIGLLLPRAVASRSEFRLMKLELLFSAAAIFCFSLGGEFVDRSKWRSAHQPITSFKTLPYPPTTAVLGVWAADLFC